MHAAVDAIIMTISTRSKLGFFFSLEGLNKLLAIFLFVVLGVSVSGEELFLTLSEAGISLTQ